MTASNSWLAGALFLVCAFPAAALADPPAAAPPPSEEQVQAARVPYREARELHRQGKVREALEKALEAYRIASTPVTALEVGQLLVERGRLVEARDIVRSISALPVSPRESDKGREARLEAATLAATLDARIPKVAIASSPAGAEVPLDDKATTASDTPAEIPAQPPPPVAAPSRTETAQPPEVAPARHESGGWQWTGIAVAGAGVAAIGVGGGIALAAKGSYDSVASQCPQVGCTTSAYGVRESARSQADAATAVVVGGAIVAAGGLLLLVLAPSTNSSIAVGVGTVHVAVSF